MAKYQAPGLSDPACQALAVSIDGFKREIAGFVIA